MAASAAPVSESLASAGYAAIPGWAADDHLAAFRAFKAGALVNAAPATAPDNSIRAKLLELGQEAVETGVGDRDSARRFFEANFFLRVVPAEGFVTGYFEPVIRASRTRSSRFWVPVYRRPPDLAEATPGLAPSGWPIELSHGRLTPHGPEEHPDRAAIEEGALAGRGLEIAFVEHPVDLFFVHVQGSARLDLAEGGTMRIGYDGKSGQPYTSIGRLAIERGLLPEERADKAGLESWLKANPAEGQALMRENRSFIFFRELAGLDPDMGPLGSAGVALHPGRSLAVDPTHIPFHMPVWVSAPELAEDGTPFARLMVAHDSGSAIVGPARGDIFFGTGAEAGERAGRVRHRADMIMLVPRALAESK